MALRYERLHFSACRKWRPLWASSFSLLVGKCNDYTTAEQAQPVGSVHFSAHRKWRPNGASSFSLPVGKCNDYTSAERALPVGGVHSAEWRPIGTSWAQRPLCIIHVYTFFCGEITIYGRAGAKIGPVVALTSESKSDPSHPKPWTQMATD